MGRLDALFADDAAATPAPVLPEPAPKTRRLDSLFADDEPAPAPAPPVFEYEEFDPGLMSAGAARQREELDEAKAPRENPKKAYEDAVQRGDYVEAAFRFPSAVRYEAAGPNAAPYTDANPRPKVFRRDPKTKELVPAEEAAPEKTSLGRLAQQGFVYGVLDPIDAVGNIVAPDVERYEGPRPVAIEEGAGTGRKIAGAIAEGAGDVAAKLPEYMIGGGAARKILSKGAEKVAGKISGRIITEAAGAAAGGVLASPAGQTLEGSAVNAVTGGAAPLIARGGQLAAARLFTDGATEGSARAAERFINATGGAVVGGGAAALSGASGADIAAQALLGGGFGAVQPKGDLPERVLPGANAKIPMESAPQAPHQQLAAQIDELLFRAKEAEQEAQAAKAAGNKELAETKTKLAGALQADAQRKIERARKLDAETARDLERIQAVTLPPQQDQFTFTPDGKVQLPPSVSRETPGRPQRTDPKITPAGTIDLGTVRVEPPALPGEPVPPRRPLVAEALVEGDKVRITETPPPNTGRVNPTVIAEAQQRMAAENRAPQGRIDPEVIRAARARRAPEIEADFERRRPEFEERAAEGEELAAGYMPPAGTPFPEKPAPAPRRSENRDTRRALAAEALAGEPAPERLTVTEEIRRSNAQTVADVQALFPERGLSREEARKLLQAAKGETPVPAPAPSAPAPRQPTTAMRVTGQEPAPAARPGQMDPEVMRNAKKRMRQESQEEPAITNPAQWQAAQQRHIAKMRELQGRDPEPPPPSPPEPPAPAPRSKPTQPDPAPETVPALAETTVAEPATVGSGFQEEPAPNPSIIRGLEVREMPTAQIQADPKTYQFKRGVDKQGVVPGEEVAGDRYERMGTAPLLVYERTDGSVYVVNGHHRLEFAQRVQEPTVPVQVIREADGVTPEQARVIGAEINIRDTTGSVEDYAGFFRERKMSEADAESKGLLARDKGRAGFSIGAGAGENLFTLFMNKGITADKARAIAEAAPGKERLQNAAIAYLQRDPKATPAELANMVRALDFNRRSKMTAADEGGGFFDDFDDSAIQDSIAMGKTAAAIQAELTEQIRAVEYAARRPAQAKKLGVDVKKPESILAKVQQLKAERAAWEKWPSNPDLVEQLRQRAGLVEEPGKFGDQNKLFTREGKDAASRKNLKRGLASNPFMDPEFLRDAGYIAGYYLEGGLREFGAWSKQMVEHFGPDVKPHLADLWKSATGSDAPARSAPAATPAESAGEKESLPVPDGARPLTDAERKIDPSEYYNPKRFGGSLVAQAELEYQIRKTASEKGLSPKKSESFDQWLREAEKHEKDPEFMAMVRRGFDKSRIPSLAQQLAARNVQTTLVERLARLEEKHAELLQKQKDEPGSVPPKDLEDVLVELDRVQTDLQAVTEFAIPMRTQAGRNLVMYRILSRKGADPTVQVARATRAKGGKLTKEETGRVTKLTKDLDKARKSGDKERISRAETALAKYHSSLAKTPILVAISNTMKAGLLASFRTIERNLGGNTSYAGIIELERGIGGMVDSILSAATKNDRQMLRRGELLSGAGSLGKETAGKAWADAKHVMRHGFTRAEMAKSVESLEVLREQNTGFKAWDAAVNSVFRFQAAQDLPFRWWHFLTALEEQAVLQGQKEKKAGKLTGTVEERAAQIRDMLSEGRIVKAVASVEERALLETILKRAREDAARNTFTSDKTFAGQVAQKIAQIEKTANESGLTGQAVAFVLDRYLPFKRTPFNIAGEVLRRVYSGARLPDKSVTTLVRTIRKTLTPEQQRAYAELVGHGSIGAGMILLGAGLAAKGLLTGPRESDTGDRDRNEAAGLQPGAARVGEKTYRVGDLFSPLSNLVVFGASLYEAFTQSAGEEESKGEAVARATAQTILDNPFFQGVQNAADIGREGGLRRSVTAAAGTAVPTLVADVAATMDGVRRDTRPVPGESFGAAVKRGVQERVPGWRESLPVRRDAMGRAMPTSAMNIVNPTFPTSDRTKSDPLMAEMVKRDVSLPKPRRLPGETDKDFDRRQMQGGRMIQTIGGRMVESEGYKRQPPGVRKYLLEQTTSRSRGAATKASPSAQISARKRRLQELFGD